MGSRNTCVSAEKDNEYYFKPFTLRRLKPNNNSFIPKGRSGHRIVSDNTYVYSFGGFNPNNNRSPQNEIFEMTLFKELLRFNISRNEWERLAHYSPSLPRELVSNAVLLRGTTMFVHGGTGVPFGQSCSNKTFVTNLKQNERLELLETKGEHPLPLYGQAMVLHGHNLYVVGGTSGLEFLCNIFCLDLRTKTWHPVYIHTGISPNAPLGRYRHEAALYNNKIIIFGGGSTISDVFELHFELKNLPAFNLLTNDWEILNTIGDPKDKSSDSVSQGFPAPRRCLGSVHLLEEEGQDSEFIICGGSNGVKIFSDIWTLNLRTLQWTKWNEDLRFPLNFHSTSLSPCGKMFIFGGICECLNATGLRTFRTNDIFSTWVKIPKLSEICWEALLFYNPNLRDFEKYQLLSIGVPLKFVERIKPS